MKTTTYLRLSLGIPFLVWALCLLVLIIIGGMESILSIDRVPGIVGALALLIMFYVFGIIGWFLPYLLLSSILLISSFRGRAQALIKVFALSPLMMSVLVLIALPLMDISTLDWDTLLSNPMGSSESFLSSPLWFILVTLFWGYVCVGIGYGIYRLLQQMGLIKDEAMTSAILISEPS